MPPVAPSRPVRSHDPRTLPPASWLQHRADDAPAYLEPDSPDVPEKYRELERRQWEEARRRVRSGEELWFFDNGPEKWKALCGRAGYAVVRGGVVVDAILTRMN